MRNYIFHAFVRFLDRRFLLGELEQQKLNILVKSYLYSLVAVEIGRRRAFLDGNCTNTFNNNDNRALYGLVCVIA